ncbi:MAG: ATP-dependent DNA ligase [Gammaproteobacteria bacterium]
MLLNRLVATSREVAGTRSQLKKRTILSDCLRGASAAELALLVDYLAGTLPQGKIGLGPAIFRELDAGPPAAEPSLDLREADRAFTEIGAISGPGSRQARLDAVGRLFARATLDERDFLVRLVLGELRQGALEAALVDGIAAAFDVPETSVRRAVMLSGAPAAVALAAMQQGVAGLDRFRLVPMNPVRPMLAQPAESMDDALQSLGEAALEYKLDGARVQIHRVGREVKVFSRQLNDVTASVPEAVEAVAAMPGDDLILDGEVLALRENGRPHPFQVTMRRFGRRTKIGELRRSLPLSVFFFDCLYRDGELIDEPFAARREQLLDLAGNEKVTPGMVTADEAKAAAFLTGALEAGHEGVMAKSLASPYAAGNRGADWLKVKQAHTLDLVVLAAEWGSGRREGWLSNLHLGARSKDGSFVMLGKTFKGLTDRTLRWQTRELLAREIGREGNVVHVRPELVVEIALNDVQQSPHYPAGLALRFARVKRYRDDKAPADADTIETVRRLYARQTGLEAPAVQVRAADA